jgi:Amt family ammonium transporter
VGGLVGMVMTGLLAHTAVNGANTTGNGLLFGETALFTVHMIALVIVVAYTFFGSLLILKVTDLISSLKISPEEKEVGQDLSQHGENMYQFDFTRAKEVL